jgi:hypothetical protein
MLPGSDPAGGWNSLFTRGLELVQTTGDHHTMLTDAHTATLAQQMDLTLRKYESDRNERTGAPEKNLTDEEARFDQAPPQPEPTIA